MGNQSAIWSTVLIGVSIMCLLAYFPPVYGQSFENVITLSDRNHGEQHVRASRLLAIISTSHGQMAKTWFSEEAQTVETILVYNSLKHVTRLDIRMSYDCFDGR